MDFYDFHLAAVAKPAPVVLVRQLRMGTEKQIYFRYDLTI